MSKVCELTGKKGLNGHRVSHAKNRSNHVQQPNLKKRRIWVQELGKYISLKVSTKGLRTIDKKGPYRALKDAGLI